MKIQDLYDLPLRPFVVDPATAIPPPGMIGADEAARRLGVSRATVYNWIEARRLIGWRRTRQGTYIPSEQIVGPGELVPGIKRILQLIPDTRAAWRFLDELSPRFDAPQRPIDALKAGNVEEVITAARASGEAFT
jgi:excisionase family DNA binding protein